MGQVTAGEKLVISNFGFLDVVTLAWSECRKTKARPTCYRFGRKRHIASRCEQGRGQEGDVASEAFLEKTKGSTRLPVSSPGDNEGKESESPFG